MLAYGKRALKTDQEMTRTRTLLPISWIVLVMFSMATCKDKEQDPVYSCNGILYDKSLENIRACVVGNWQILYRKGGFTGNWRQDFTDTYLKIRPNDSVYYVEGNVLKVQTKITWKSTTTIQGKSTFAISPSAGPWRGASRTPTTRSAS